MTFHKEILEFQKETSIGMQQLANQITQLATTVNKLDTQSGKISTQPEPHVRNVTVVTTVNPFDFPESSEFMNFVTNKESNESFGFDKK